MSKTDWNGLCPAGKHGLDYEGQPCDLCLKPTKAARERAALVAIGRRLDEQVIERIARELSAAYADGAASVVKERDSYRRAGIERVTELERELDEAQRGRDILKQGLEQLRKIYDKSSELLAAARAEAETLRGERDATREFLGRDLREARERILTLEIQNKRAETAVTARDEVLRQIKEKLDHPPGVDFQHVCRVNVEAWKMAHKALNKYRDPVPGEPGVAICSDPMHNHPPDVRCWMPESVEKKCSSCDKHSTYKDLCRECWAEEKEQQGGSRKKKP